MPSKYPECYLQGSGEDLLPSVLDALNEVRIAYSIFYKSLDKIRLFIDSDTGLTSECSCIASTELVSSQSLLFFQRNPVPNLNFGLSMHVSMNSKALKWFI